MNPRPYNRVLTIFCFTLFIGLLIECDSVTPKKLIGNDNPDYGTVHIVYNGITSEDHQSVASFSLINDSTEAIQYFAYSKHSLHYSTEVLTDTGWVYLMWNWCGTGASYYVLEVDSSVQFCTVLPQDNCTWRVLVDITDMEYENHYTLRSEEIDFSVP